MFKRLTSGNRITFYFNNETIYATAGDTVAAALLANGYCRFRESPVNNEHRGPFCMMGACYECLVKMDGKTVQACMVAATQDLQINRISKP